MRKFIILLSIICLFSSCGITTSECVGNITWMNDNGVVVRTWEDATFQMEVTTNTSSHSSSSAHGGGYSYNLAHVSGSSYSVNGSSYSTSTTTFKNAALTGGWLQFNDSWGSGMVISGGMILIEDVNKVSEVKHPLNELVESRDIKKAYKYKKLEMENLTKYLETAPENEKAEINEAIAALEKEMEDMQKEYYKKTGSYIN